VDKPPAPSRDFFSLKLAAFYGTLGLSTGVGMPFFPIWLENKGVSVAELVSITRAAAHLHLAQPALTRHVQRLEEELGVALFTRANRGVRLTEAGQKLLDGAVRILRDVERTGDEIRAQDAHPSGRIILGVTPTLCPVLVPDLFAAMRAEFPRIELKVMHAGMIRLEEFLIDGRVDIALLSELSRSRLILSTGLGREEMVLVTRPGARPSGVVSGAELSRTQLVLGDGLRAAMDALLAGRGVELKVAIEVNDHETIRLMVTRGVAASILPYSSVARDWMMASLPFQSQSKVKRVCALEWTGP